MYKTNKIKTNSKR